MKFEVCGQVDLAETDEKETKTNAETKTKKEMVVKMVTHVVLVDDFVSSCEIAWCIQRLLSITGSRQAAHSSYS